MSETTTIAAPVADVVTDAPAPVAVTPKTVDVPLNDRGVKLEDALDRIQLLLDAANTLPSDNAQRIELDARAFALAAKHTAVDRNGAIVKFRETLPAYGEAGKGSLRYTKERATLLLGLANELGVAARLDYTKYTYPNPKTGRRNYFVDMWGVEENIASTLRVFYALQARGIKETYAVPVGDAKPAQQTKIRREFFQGFADSTPRALASIMDALPRKSAEVIQDRKSRAEQAMDATATTASVEGDDA